MAYIVLYMFCRVRTIVEDWKCFLNTLHWLFHQLHWIFLVRSVPDQTHEVSREQDLLLEIYNKFKVLIYDDDDDVSVWLQEKNDDDEDVKEERKNDEANKALLKRFHRFKPQNTP